MKDYSGALDALAAWTVWLRLEDIRTQITPGNPGVYMARYADSGHIFYVGESHRRGVRERLDEYRLGNDLNGLGSVLADLAFADPGFVRERLDEIESGSPRTAVQWMKLAMTRRSIEFSVAETADGQSAQVLEEQVLAALPSEHLLNKAAVRARRLNGK
ncbi:hypothetical protein B2J88_01700 [Rhodococcus sp. SRB_17]|nr:hypothetical protein [Rhodococcus sp. SRB_17]